MRTFFVLIYWLVSIIATIIPIHVLLRYQWLSIFKMCILSATPHWMTVPQAKQSVASQAILLLSIRQTPATLVEIIGSRLPFFARIRAPAKPKSKKRCHLCYLSILTPIVSADAIAGRGDITDCFSVQTIIYDIVANLSVQYGEGEASKKWGDSATVVGGVFIESETPEGVITRLREFSLCLASTESQCASSPKALVERGVVTDLGRQLRSARNVKTATQCSVLLLCIMLSTTYMTGNGTLHQVSFVLDQPVLEAAMEFSCSHDKATDFIVEATFDFAPSMELSANNRLRDEPSGISHSSLLRVAGGSARH